MWESKELLTGDGLVLLGRPPWAAPARQPGLVSPRVTPQGGGCFPKLQGMEWGSPRNEVTAGATQPVGGIQIVSPAPKAWGQEVAPPEWPGSSSGLGMFGGCLSGQGGGRQCSGEGSVKFTNIYPRATSGITWSLTYGTPSPSRGRKTGPQTSGQEHSPPVPLGEDIGLPGRRRAPLRNSPREVISTEVPASGLLPNQPCEP